jgi:outer membrane protein assembly factor BamB
VYERSHIYGIHGREDSGVAELRCIDANNGQVAWKKTDFGVANLLIAGQIVIAITGDGQIVLFEATPTKYVEIGRSRYSNDEVRAIPAVSNDRLYVRDSKQLFSIQIGR